MLRDKGYPVSERRISIDEVIEASKNGTLDEAFGTGTAAVISPVGLIRYKDEDYVINGGVSGILAFGSNGEFYISIKNDANGDAMAIIADLAVIDTDETGTSIDGIEDNSNGEGISIIPEDGGITIATDNKTSVKAVKIYSVTGMVVRTVNLNGSSKFVPLEAGLYIVGGKTVAVK